MKNDFYVGYASRAPRGVADFVRRVVVRVGLGAVVLAVLLVTLQRPFSAAVFEFGEYSIFEGVASTDPYPALQLTGPEGSTRTVLVGRFGKFGAQDSFDGFDDGATVRFRGSLAYRADAVTVEIEEGSVESVSPRAREAGEDVEVEVEDLGHHRLLGEIVDSKCWAGVMKPGEGKVHKSCAVRCISGGIPPAFVVRGKDAEGYVLVEDRVLVLLTRSGGPAGPGILPLVGERVFVDGRLERRDDRIFLLADAADFELSHDLRRTAR